MRPDMTPQQPQPPQRPTMDGMLPKPQGTKQSAAASQWVQPGQRSQASPDPSHLLGAPHQAAIEEHSEVPVNHLVLSDIDNHDSKPPKPRRRRWIVGLSMLIVFGIVVAAGIVGGKMWYEQQLQPMTTDESTNRIRVSIEMGMTPDQIGKLLKDKGVIRSDIVFSWYTQEKGVQNQLQAGTYSLKPSESLAQIVDHLAAGKTDEFSITFLPGDTLANNRERFIKAGYDQQEVDAALEKVYSHPALATKPNTADLEGYLYGETYSFTGDATPDQIVTRTLDELQKQIVKYDLVNAYKKRNLTLFEGITLASIIQREVSGEADEKQVAQVFYKRLKDGMPLGSDVTYIYAAKKMGVTATPALQSPYNTRIHKGLPPGPIATPGLSALLAVASPASGDYNYFLAGDDGKTYFAHTYAQHEANIVNHCQKGCQ